jgi:hypothetical protein
LHVWIAKPACESRQRPVSEFSKLCVQLAAPLLSCVEAPSGWQSGAELAELRNELIRLVLRET